MCAAVPDDVADIIDEIVATMAAIEVEPAIYPYLSVLIAEMALLRGCLARPEIGLQVRGKLANAYCWISVNGCVVDPGSMIAYQSGSIAGYFPAPVLQAGFSGDYTRIDFETREGRENADIASRVLEAYKEGGPVAVWLLYDTVERPEKCIFGVLQQLRDKFATHIRCARCGSRADMCCARCRTEAYCSRACQLLRWRNCHGLHCAAVTARLLARQLAR